MALKDLINLIDNKLSETFHTKPHDPVKARKPVLAGIDRTRTQFLATEPSRAPNKWWKAKNNVVEFTAKPGGQALQINGQDTNYIPSERFPDFLAAFEKAVNAGDFDAEIENHGKGSATVSRGSGTRTNWSNDPAEFRRQFEDKFGPAPSANHVPNSARTKWVDKKFVERGKRAHAARGK